MTAAQFMTDASPADEVLDGLRARPAAAIDGAYVLGVEELSGRLAASRVFRLRLTGATPSIVLKVPDWRGTSAVQPRDPMVRRRECLLLQSGLLDRLPKGLRLPEFLGVESRAGRTWIWLEDVGKALGVRWDGSSGVAAARRCALLHDFYRGEHTQFEELSWLSRDEFLGYAHHVAEAHDNLDRLRSVRQHGAFFDFDEIARLHRCLDVADEAAAAMRRLPQSFIHGDFHIRNLGLDGRRRLVLLDLAHAGIAPLGCDIATMLSVFTLFGGEGGGRGSRLESQVIAGYAGEIRRIEGRDLRRPIERAIALWHLTWGLHLRLGPGLGALLAGHIADPDERACAARDILEGCERALEALESEPL